MDIVYKSNDKMMEFSIVDRGKVFRYHHQLYLKVDKDMAFNLQENKLYAFGPDEDVSIVKKCYLVIE